ncbi:MAG: Xaa-Pro peptidase family protein [Candidatus Peribacteraceae bacterium]|nr:Xaa-Pro peptidase family protein [Candidatus Peribacteraceae bacterium]
MRPVTPAALLRQAGSAVLLVTDLVNIRYLSGVAVSTGAMLVTPRRFLLFVDDRYGHRAEQTALPGVAVRDRDEIAQFLRGEPECGFEADKVSVARKSGWKRAYPRTKFVRTIGAVEAFRRQKDEGEIRLLKRAQRITKEILRRIPAALRADTTEERLARQLQIWALELGADGLSFDPIVAFGTNTGNPHHMPSSRALKKGHLVQVDVGAKVRGYCADMSRVFFTATPTPQQQMVYEALLATQRKATAAAKAGVTNHALDAIARKVLAANKLDGAFTHALGHGVGLDIHEGIVLSGKREKMPLLSGEVVTVEPGVYFAGKFGMRIEDMVFVE